MNSANDGELAVYRTVAGIGAMPADFMKMAIDALLAFLRQAETGIATGDRPGKAKALNSAGRLVEFMLGISGSDPGRLSEGLAQVYRYVSGAILRANADDDGEAVAAAGVAVQQLAAIWRTRFPDMELSQIPGSSSSGG
jgi:flagellin-specific chaperone FliS